MRKLFGAPIGWVLFLAGLLGLLGFLGKFLAWGGWRFLVVKTVDELITCYSLPNFSDILLVGIVGHVLALLGINYFLVKKYHQGGSSLAFFGLVFGNFSLGLFILAGLLEMALCQASLGHQVFLTEQALKIYSAFLANLLQIFFPAALILSAVYYWFLGGVLFKSKKFLEIISGILALIYFVLFAVNYFFYSQNMNSFWQVGKFAQNLFYYLVYVLIGLAVMAEGEKEVKEPEIQPVIEKKPEPKEFTESQESVIKMKVSPEKEKHSFFRLGKSKKRTPQAPGAEGELELTKSLFEKRESIFDDEKVIWKPTEEAKTPAQETKAENPPPPPVIPDSKSPL